jgi:hypothetical protein
LYKSMLSFLSSINACSCDLSAFSNCPIWCMCCRPTNMAHSFFKKYWSFVSSWLSLTTSRFRLLLRRFYNRFKNGLNKPILKVFNLLDFFQKFPIWFFFLYWFQFSAELFQLFNLFLEFLSTTIFSVCKLRNQSILVCIYFWDI